MLETWCIREYQANVSRLKLTVVQDYAISIATIHHLATVERRREAVKVSSKSEYCLALFVTNSFPDHPTLSLANTWQSIDLCMGDTTR